MTDFHLFIDSGKVNGSILGSNEMRVILRFREWAPT